MPLNDRPHVLGIDIGGTKLAAGVLAPDGRVLAWRATPSRRSEGPDEMICRQIALAREVVDEAAVPWDEIGLVGIGCGGPLDPAAGTIHEPPNLPGWREVQLVRHVEEALGRPTILENDATAALVGELWYGAARGRRDVVYLTISTGIGGALALDGRVRRGAAGNAGEFGHLSIALDGWRCPCGRRGCLEAFASGTNIARRARERARATLETTERDAAATLVRLAGSVDGITAEHVVAAARHGDRLACEIWTATTDAIGNAVVGIANALNPELVVVGGGVSGAGEMLFEPLRRLARRALPPAARAHIAPAALGPQVGVVGAAAAALERSGFPAPDAGEFDDHLDVVEASRRLLPELERATAVVRGSLEGGGQILAFGNGGSAADAQHLAAELVGRFRRARRALPAIALTTDPSIVTGIGNDFGYDEVFARQIEALAGRGDVVVGLSTSGGSANVVRGLSAGRAAGATTVLFTGGSGGAALAEADLALVVPSTSTARIQEVHGLFIHLLSEAIDHWAVLPPVPEAP